MNKILDNILNRVIVAGTLTVTWAKGETTRYGSGNGHSAHLIFRTEAAEKAVMKNPALRFGEVFMDGGIDFVGGPMGFLLLVNENWNSIFGSAWVRRFSRLQRNWKNFWERNNLKRARQNVAHHYDLDDRLYRLFLDSDRQYSCAYFERPETDLEEAQWAKKRHLAAKLEIEPGQKVLDIGCGWGGLGLFIADQTGADVTGVTLSTEQHKVANQRASDKGLSSRTRFELRDYRSLETKFDRIVSVGMFEHVGTRHYREFFQQVARLLKDDGVMVLHSIGRSDGPGSTNPWILKYIFPGGYIPALSEVLPAIEEAGLVVTDIEILRLHYAKTLKAWRERFLAHREEAKAVYDERFCRMWEFYLCGSEAAFINGGMMNFQIQLVKDQNVLPLTRDYMFEADRAMDAAHRQIESGTLEGFRLAGE
ncbi:cyclopropane-fatty-acyl-phospholipid synthase [Faunimonas pinastri]|uniref:Cyclopropane-fatty-acyl-phospholipid synthase n=1 Tax=Faunimonas pinastri TaxID=1855383 RepID=A0A1H9DF82_9HYPH|nr:cyclopropane-fatty-acyl-phospholipid synthase family protein [Faunimonas pinastri]SEQ11398.1 cyclopropane-fatty-acyl-phospholipid synthase [Faunimonas pinastri]